MQIMSLKQVPKIIAGEEKKRQPYFPSPADWRDTPIYFLLVDRFNKAGHKNPIYKPDIPQEKADLSTAYNWQGGNINGITEKLDYIKGLGFSAIWVSPVFKNRHDTYHGYGIQNFFEIDEHFGTLEDLQKLVKEAHKRNIYIILDIVINHTGDNWAYKEGPKKFDGKTKYEIEGWRTEDNKKLIPLHEKIISYNDAVWPLEFQNPEWYLKRGEIKNWEHPAEIKHGDLCSLKKLDTSNSEVIAALVTIYKYWIAMTDIDGYRLDAVKHINEPDVAKFCHGIRDYAEKIGKKNFFLFGEILAEDPIINIYLGRNAAIPGTKERFNALDAALDYPLWKVLQFVIKGFLDPGILIKRYESVQNNFSDHGKAYLFFITFIDNHDMNKRFLHCDKYSRQAVLAIGYLLTSWGIPCIYYGTEQGFDGGDKVDDIHIRETMWGGKFSAFGTSGVHFFDVNHELYKGISDIAKIRNEEPALRYGRLYFRKISTDKINFGFPVLKDHILTYSRIQDDTEILVVMNLNCHESNTVYINIDSNLMPVDAKLEDLLTHREYIVEKIRDYHAVAVTLPPLTMSIIKLHSGLHTKIALLYWLTALLRQTWKRLEESIHWKESFFSLSFPQDGNRILLKWYLRFRQRL